jgi:hypothetical protein
LSAIYNAGQDGTYRKSPISTTFEGTFNGLGNTISNQTIDGNEEKNGLFADIDTAGTVDSLAMVDVNIRAKMKRRQVGSCAGSIAGTNYGTVYNNYANGAIRGIAGNFMELGGLAGCNQGGILNSAASTTLSASSPRRKPGTAVIGGLVGQSGGTGTIQQSYATGAVSSTAAYSGGLVGINGGAIDNCYAEGNLTVSGSSSYVGGLVGFAGPNSSTNDSYSTGSPNAQGSNEYVGGFLGFDDNGSAGLSDDYWDTTTSGISNLSQGVGNVANDPGVTGETTAQLQSGLPAGFDPTIWAEDSNINNGLPYLIANPPQ